MVLLGNLVLGMQQQKGNCGNLAKIRKPISRTHYPIGWKPIPQPTTILAKK